MRLISNMIGLFISVICMPAQVLTWQNVSKEEVKKVMKIGTQWFDLQNKCAINIDYISYKDHFSNIEMDRQSGYYKKSGSNYTTDLLNIKTIVNNKYKIIIDTANEMIVIADKDKNKANVISENVYDELIDRSTAIKKRNNNGKTVYRIEGEPDFEVLALEIIVDEKGRLLSIIYYYNEREDKVYDAAKNNLTYQTKIVSPRLEMCFKNYDAVPVLSDKDFMDEHIQLIEHNKVNLKNTYKYFTLKDLRK
jgi:hypothetical protein